jgi:hypothetical protein
MQCTAKKNCFLYCKTTVAHCKWEVDLGVWGYCGSLESTRVKGRTVQNKTK